jgi:DNA-directed RNA polymerase specialized sigma24 family protein
MDRQEGSLGDREPEEAVDEEDASSTEGRSQQTTAEEPAALRGLSEAEQRLILDTVDRFWQRWVGTFTVAAKEDLVAEAALVMRAVRARAARLEEGIRAGLIAIAIDRRLRRRARDDHRRRLRRSTRHLAPLDAERLRAMDEESDSEWEAAAGETLAEIIGDERVAAAFQALKPTDQRILDLWLIEGLTHHEIADRLNASPEKLSGQRKLTAAVVTWRCERALNRLNEG